MENYVKYNEKMQKKKGSIQMLSKNLNVFEFSKYSKQHKGKDRS